MIDGTVTEKRLYDFEQLQPQPSSIFDSSGLINIIYCHRPTTTTIPTTKQPGRYNFFLLPGSTKQKIKISYEKSMLSDPTNKVFF